jgi:quinolinate synthase
MTTEVTVDPAVSARARIAIDRMLAVKTPGLMQRSGRP